MNEKWILDTYEFANGDHNIAPGIVCDSLSQVLENLAALDSDEKNPLIGFLCVRKGFTLHI